MKQRSDGRWLKVRSINGKKINFYSTAKTEKAAIKDIENQMLLYIEKQNKAKKFKECAEQWRVEHEPEVSYKTWQGYKAHYNRAIQEFGEFDITEIATSDIQLYINKLSKKGYSYKTVKYALNIISMIFDSAIMNRAVKSNPCNYVKIANNLPRKERELPEDKEIEKVKQSLNCHFGDFAYLLLHTGIRRGEALALHVDDIDFENRIIHIRRSVYFKSNRPELKDPKTKAGTRDIYLLDPLIPILKKKKGYIFGENAPMSEQAFRRAWERYIKESNVKITPHQLRHAYATILYENGISEKSAQKLLGHADIKTTLAIYTHISEKRNQSDFQKLNEIFKS